jgi:hypothetical protein
MITYDRLAETPDAFLPLTGLSREEFDHLFGAFTTAAEAHRTARTHTKRGHRRLVRLTSVAAVATEFPAVRVIIDAKEQGFRRPAGWEEQKPFYSGKKKRHTIKNQVVCTPVGRIESVSKTAPGRSRATRISCRRLKA